MPGGLLSTSVVVALLGRRWRSRWRSRGSRKARLWVGMDDSTVQVTKDGGKTWANVSPQGYAGVDDDRGDRGIAARPRDGVSGGAPHTRSATGRRTSTRPQTTGSTWQQITNGIRAKDFARTIREDPVRPGLLYAGTETGVYVSFDAGTNWQSLQRNLPAVPAQYMHVKRQRSGGGHARPRLLDHGQPDARCGRSLARRSPRPRISSRLRLRHRYLPVRVLSPNRPFRPGVAVRQCERYRRVRGSTRTRRAHQTILPQRRARTHRAVWSSTTT